MDTVGGVTDAQIDKAMRSRGPDSPDVISSFSPDNVGRYCHSGGWADLDPAVHRGCLSAAVPELSATPDPRCSPITHLMQFPGLFHQSHEPVLRLVGDLS